MGRIKKQDKNIRKLGKTGNNRSINITLPIEFIRELKWREKQKVVVSKKGSKLIITDWKKIMRLFFSINLPQDIKVKLGNISQDLKNQLPPAKWVETENIHLTIKFIGDTGNDELLEVIGVSQQAVMDLNQIEIRINDLEIFPLNHPRIIFAQVNSKPLNKMVKTFIKKIDSLDFVRSENKKFLPHITLARLKSPITMEHLKLISDIDFQESFTARSIELMSSELTSQEPAYQVVKSFAFKYL